MPEGHTLFRLAGALDDAFAGTTPSVTSPQGRFAEGAALLDGLAFRRASAWGKHLFVEFDDDRWLNVHLGLIGKFSVDAYDRYAGVPPVRGQVRLRLLTDSHVADLRGAIVCAVVTSEQVEATMARLGPDPLRPGQDPDRSWERIRRSGRSIAELLMDQSVVAGVGNVYRSELLFRHRVDPFRPGNQIRQRTWQAIWEDVVTLMALGVSHGQILTMTDQVEVATAQRASGEPLESSESMESRHYVYKRRGEPCRVCGSRIRTKLVAGRNLFWCGRCQRRR